MSSLLVTFLASFMIWIMFFGIVILWVVDGRVTKEVALHSLVAAVFALGLAELLKNIFQVTRPFVVNGTEALTVFDLQDWSFPSAHTAACFALATTVWLHNKRIGAVFLIAAFVAGAGRILANVHFPADIIAGALLGATIAVTFEKLHVYRLLDRA